MSSSTKRGWKWAYQKIRSLQCSRLCSLYRATRFAIKGDTGTFHNPVSWQKIRIRR
ncbi:hypothetical protein [Pseudomonas sp.]|uniref:hypothetical protein n=1 Tax=Pseudomonas sp. TaxID=306 RepID=UPI002617ADB3|nr:hypothetical protein [Pseudomonas sp.]